MKERRPLVWHEACLANAERFLKNKEEVLARAAAEVERLKATNARLRKKIEDAKRKGLKELPV